MLHALETFTPLPHPTQTSILIKTPKSYWYDETEKIQIIQYIRSTAPLSTALRTLITQQAYDIGYALGHWLHAFHTHTSAASTRHLSEEISQNEEEIKLKYKLTWEQGSSALHLLSSRNLLAISDEESAAWEAAKARARKEMQDMDIENVGVVHGDFWAGKYVLLFLLRVTFFLSHILVSSSFLQTYKGN